MIEILKWILKLKEYKDIFIKYIAPRNLEIYTSFTPVFAHLQTIDVVWMPAVVTIKRVLPWMSVRSDKHIWKCLRCTVSNLKKTRLKLSFISECLFSKCSERDRRHEKGSIGENRGGCTEVFNSNTVKEVLPLSQNKL